MTCMRPVTAAATSLLLLALAQSVSAQQAGDAASTDTEGTFQKLIEACDDTDALMLRARIRLQLPRTTPEAAANAQKMLDQGFATCGGGDLEKAKEQLTEALAIAEAGATEKFGTDASGNTEAKEEAPAPANNDRPADSAPKERKPWWKFW